MKLYHTTWTRRELEARVGRLEQIGGVRRLSLVGGPEANVEQIQVRTGAGLTYYVVPSRGLDISLTDLFGAPISWQSPNGDVHPAYFEPQGMGWLRTAVGGLLMTCGLMQVGSPNVDQGEALGLHGRIHHLPARQVSATGRWSGDEYEMEIRGVVEETTLFGPSLRLTRRIHSRLGQNRIDIHDEVENFGFQTTPHMILYHFNLGFPLMSEESRIQFPSRQVIPRDDATPLQGFDVWQAPQPAFQERVYYHERLQTQDGWAHVRIDTPHFPAGVDLKPLTLLLGWRVENLPRLVEWKMPGQGTHVLGIEPANCHVEGRARERELGTLTFLEPGEKRTYDLFLDFQTS